MSRRASASRVKPCQTSTPRMPRTTRLRSPRKHPDAPAPCALKQLLLVLCAAQLMVILDITAVNVALPDLAKGLGIDGGDIGWTITSYSLIFGSLLLLGGRAADLLGRRRMFLTGLASSRSPRSPPRGRQRRDAVRRARRARDSAPRCCRPPRSRS